MANSKTSGRKLAQTEEIQNTRRNKTLTIGICIKQKNTIHKIYFNLLL